jgi:hypothetical protein
MKNNPFEITKAVDFTDSEIERTFVQFADTDPYAIADPRSAMPQFLVGGKGGGRTHLMRHLSYSHQMEAGTDILPRVREEGYLGVYLRCSGLNGSRFQGKGQSTDAWNSAFAFYMDIWLCEELVVILSSISAKGEHWSIDEETAFYLAVASKLGFSFEDPLNIGLSPLKKLHEQLSSLRRNMDAAINNAALSGSLQLTVLSNPGEIVFSASAAATQLKGLSNAKITFLVDEFENLTEDQQRYFNTLLREKVLPTCFLIGGREWGVKTHNTMSANEKNIKGSEYEWIVLEDRYRRDKELYRQFCEGLVANRLRAAGHGWVQNNELPKLFDGFDDDRFESQTLLSLFKDQGALERPHMVRLMNSVGSATGDSNLAREIAAALSVPMNPLLEKLAILRFYQAWSDNRGISLANAQAAAAYVTPLAIGNADKSLTNFYNLRKSDLIAQLYWENGKRLPYIGFDLFMDMSGFLPRSMLMILKYVTYWSNFLGEEPFEQGKTISTDAQNAGVRDAAKWFLADAKPLGQLGEDCDRAIRKIGFFLSSLRRADKPSEVNVSTFSTNMHGVSKETREVLEACVSHRLLVEIGGGRAARNQGPVHRKFQVHPMLAPLYGLSSGRRGEISLKADETAAIFSPAAEESEYTRCVEARTTRLQAPFGAIAVRAETLFDLD